MAKAPVTMKTNPMAVQIARIQSSDIASEVIDGEIMIMNLQNGKYYSMDGVGIEIWQQLLAQQPLESIKSGLARQYDADHHTIDVAVEELVALLVSEELISIEKSDQELVADPDDADLSDGKQEFVPPSLQIHTDMEELLLLDPIHDVDTGVGWPHTQRKN